MLAAIRTAFALMYFPLMIAAVVLDAMHPNSALSLAIVAMLVAGLGFYFINPPDQGG